MVRFQTRVAELLEKETGPMPEYAGINWKSLGERVGLAPATLRAWHKARVGSTAYLKRIDGDVLGKLTEYFGVGPDEIVVAVSGEENTDSLPHSFQKSVTPARSFAG